MTTAYQGPLGAIFVEPVPGGFIRLTVQQGRTYAHLEIEAGRLESVISHLRDATKALEPPLMDVGSTNGVPLVCRTCAALIHPKNDEFHQRWHEVNP